MGKKREDSIMFSSIATLHSQVADPGAHNQLFPLDSLN
jgi:hypothetical protein